MTEILPVQPAFRKKNTSDPSRDGFVSVTPFKSGVTIVPGGEIYKIRLTEDQFKEFKFREYTGSGELRTRQNLPIHSKLPKKSRH